MKDLEIFLLKWVEKDHNWLLPRSRVRDLLTGISPDIVENIWFAALKSSVEPLEPKPAPINSMSCAADKDLLLSLDYIAKYINGMGHK